MHGDAYPGLGWITLTLSGSVGGGVGERVKIRLKINTREEIRRWEGGGGKHRPFYNDERAAAAIIIRSEGWLARASENVRAGEPMRVRYGREK